MKIRFSDGEEFDTSGPYRVEGLYDGYYVVGEGLIIPVGSREEGEALINQLEEDDK